MKKITIILFSVFFILSANTKVQAQLVSIGVGGGLTQVLGPDSYISSTGKLGFSSEYNFGVIAKVGLPVIPITPRAFILYHKMSDEGSPITTFKGNDVTSTTVEISQSILSVGVGAQFGFIPIPVGIDPYLSLDLTFNNFGEFTTTTNGSETTTEGNSRMGLQFGIGAELTIIPMINVDVFAGYNLYNLTGKEDGEETISALTVDLFFMFNFL